jgi:hypothetical protein
LPPPFEARYQVRKIYRNPTFQVVADREGADLEEAVVHVGGQVGRTGPVKFHRGLTLWQAIQTAGGPTPFGTIGASASPARASSVEYDLREVQNMNIRWNPMTRSKCPRKNPGTRFEPDLAVLPALFEILAIVKSVMPHASLCETFVGGTSAIIWGFGPLCACGAEEFPSTALENFKSEDFRTRESAQANCSNGRGNPGIAMDRLFGQSQTADDPEARERCLAVLRELVGDEYQKEGEGYIGIRMQEETGKVPGDPNRAG